MINRGLNKFLLLACIFSSSKADLVDVTVDLMDIPLDPKFGLMFEWAKKEGAQFDSIELRH